MSGFVDPDCASGGWILGSDIACACDVDRSLHALQVDLRYAASLVTFNSEQNCLTAVGAFIAVKNARRMTNIMGIAHDIIA